MKSSVGNTSTWKSDAAPVVRATRETNLRSIPPVEPEQQVLKSSAPKPIETEDVDPEDIDELPEVQDCSSILANSVKETSEHTVI